MRDIDLNRLDLNLLKVFIAIFDEGNVTAAGVRLGLAQSSMSHALMRLRSALQDTLFVRCASGMVPTSYAELIATPIRHFLNGLEATLDRGREFDPTLSDRTFTLVMNDLGEAAFLPTLISHLHKHAPDVKVSVLQVEPAMYRETLESGQADLVIGLLPPGQPDFFQQRLFDAEFGCLMRDGHPIQKKLTLETFLQARHLVVASHLMSEQLIQRALLRLASQRHIALEVPHYTIVPRVLLKTDLIAVLPLIVGSYGTVQGKLARLPCPFKIEPLVLRQIWHAKSQHDSGCRWLRQQFALLFRSRRTDLEIRGVFSNGPDAPKSDGGGIIAA